MAQSVEKAAHLFIDLAVSRKTISVGDVLCLHATRTGECSITRHAQLNHSGYMQGPHTQHTARVEPLGAWILSVEKEEATSMNEESMPKSFLSFI